MINLDLSWNALGRNPRIATTIGNYLAGNKSLRHLDLSYNFFTLEQVKTIGTGLASNQTLLGLHMHGAPCKFDSKGFLIPCENKGATEDAHMGTHTESNCWI